MKSVFTVSIFTLLFTLVCCTRTSTSGQQPSSTPDPLAEKAETTSFGETIFKGSGNEPFWFIQIDKNHNLILKSIDDHQIKLNTSITEITRVNDAKAFHLKADIPDGKLTIILMDTPCQDNMSDKESSHALQVLVQTPTMDKPVLYKGCGKYLNEYQVNKNWKLESINGRNIADLPTEKTPTLNINLLENKVDGFAGCNTFFGAVKIEKGKLKFGNIGLTKKACKNNTTEAVFVKLLNDSKQKHAITKDGKLLMKGAEQTLIFKATK